MNQASLLFGQPDARILPGNNNPSPPSFANFRFSTIGQQPELLKRISAPEPDYNYQDHSSPEPSVDHDNSAHSTPKALSRPTLYQVLAAQADSQDVPMTDDTDGMVVDTHPVGSTGAPFIPSHIVPRGVSHFSTTPLDPARPPLGWNETNSAPLNPRMSEGPSSGSSQVREREGPYLNSSEPHNAAKTSDHTSVSPDQPVDVTMVSVQGKMPSPPQVGSSPIPHRVDPITLTPGPPPPPTRDHDSAYAALRAIQARLLSSFSSLKPPQMDTSHALHLVQAAHSQSATALSTAHRAHTLAQQAVTVAHDAAVAAQESLHEAEQAKTHASAAVSAVEQIGNPDSVDSCGLKNEWEWKTTFAEVQDILRSLGEWVGRQEGEEAARRREMERAEKERKNRESVESAMRLTNGSLRPQIARAVSVEASRRSTATESQVRSSEASVQTSSHESRLRSPLVSRASAEMEADAARRAWSLEHSGSNAMSPTSALTVEEQRETEEERRRALIAKQIKLIDKRLEQKQAQKQQQEHEQEQQKKKEEEEAESRRMQDLNRQKLEVAQFHIKERERQERLQQEEAARRAAEARKLQKEADLLEEQRKKAKEAEAVKIAEVRARNDNARADREARLEKQRLEEVSKAQERLVKERREEAARGQARLEQQKAEEAEAKRATEQRARDEEARKVAEESAKAAMMVAYEEALEQQKRREVQELKKKRMQEADEARAKLRAEAEEKRLHEEQEKKRQEVMANKQRATAETAAKILAERAQKEKEKIGGPPTTPKSISPPIPVSTPCAPSTSQSPLTHPLPLPVHQSPSAHIGNLTAKKTVAPSGDASKVRARAISGGVKLGTADEQPEQSQPQSPAESMHPPSPNLTRAAALGLRDKVPPIPKRSNRSSSQIASQLQVEGNISSAKRLGKTQLSADARSSPSTKPPSQVLSDMTPSDIGSSGPITPMRQAARLPGDRDPPTPMTPRIPTLAFGDGEEPPNNNNRSLLEPPPEPVSVHLRGQDKGNLHVITQSRASHASPQAQAANLRFVKDEKGVLWNKYLKPDPDAQVKSELDEEDDDLPAIQVKKGSESTSPVLPKRRLEKVHPASNAEPVSPSPIAPGRTLATLGTSACTARKPNPDPTAQKPRAPNAPASNATRSKAPAPSPTVSTLNDSTPTSATPPKPKLPSFKKYSNTDDIPRVSTNASADPPVTNTTGQRPTLESSLSASDLLNISPPPAGPPETQTHKNNASSFFEDSTIAPVIQGDGGWNSYDGTPPGLGRSSTYNLGSTGSTWLDAEPAREAVPRRPAPRMVDHYSPPPRQPSNTIRRSSSSQDQRSVSGPRPVRPNIQTNSGTPRDRTPPPRTPPPPMEHLPVLGKRRYREDDSLRSQPIRRQRQTDPQPGRDEGLAHTPPLPERRSPTPERPAGLQSRIGQREAGYGADVYRPTYASDHYSSAYYSPPSPPPRGYDSYHPAPPRNTTYDASETKYSSYHPPSTRDRYSNLGRHQVTETRPDLLDRMAPGSASSFNPTINHRGRPASAPGAFRGRRGRGGFAGGGRPLEQRIGTSYNNNSVPLMNRLESPPPPRYY